MGAERHESNEPGRQRLPPLPRQENGNAEKGVTGIKDRCHQDAGAEIGTPDAAAGNGAGWLRRQRGSNVPLTAVVEAAAQRWAEGPPAAQRS
mgnify:CR=1 FL=1